VPTVRFLPNDVSVEVNAGETLLEAAMLANVAIAATCGGTGTCGKCKVIIEQGSVAGGHGPKLSTSYADSGYVLACKAEVTGDVIVRIPLESVPGKLPNSPEPLRASTVISAEDGDAGLPHWRIDPPVRMRSVKMQAPDLTDNCNDANRLLRALRGSGVAQARLSIGALRRLPHVARKGEWDVQALTCESDRHVEVVDLRAAHGAIEAYAVAVDLGTTTVCAQLIDLSNGAVIAESAEYNSQVAHGADVISRIVFATTPGGLDRMRSLAVQSISSVVNTMVEQACVRPDDVVSYSVAGNTAMTHMLLGLAPDNIRSEPYVPVASEFPPVRARELGLPGAAEARLTAVPCPASYVGGDIVAGVLAAGLPWSDKLTLYIDIGTNGEIVLGNKEWMVACACSAGPAFEGGGVLHGMRAAAGAIERVRIDHATLEPMLLTIGHAPPLGICGSGFVGCVAELFLAGAIDRGGKFDQDRACSRVREGEHGWEYLLVGASESGTGHDIVITEGDIENLMRAKAAVYAGIGVLMESVDVGFDDLDEVLVAGTFGRYLELDEVVTIGLLPELPRKRFRFVGNGSLRGARLVALSRDMTRVARKTSDNMTYLELSINAAFMDMYVSAMFLPHTDLGLFPNVATRLKPKKVSR